MYQPDPPGLMHDDPRLLPPWRGSSLLSAEVLQVLGCFADLPVPVVDSAGHIPCERWADELCTAASPSTDLHLRLVPPRRAPAR